MWSVDTGKKEFEFSVGSCGVSSMDIDSTGKRQDLIKLQGLSGFTLMMLQDCDWES